MADVVVAEPITASASSDFRNQRSGVLGVWTVSSRFSKIIASLLATSVVDGHFPLVNGVHQIDGRSNAESPPAQFRSVRLRVFSRAAQPNDMCAVFTAVTRYNGRLFECASRKGAVLLFCGNSALTEPTVTSPWK